MSTSEKGGTTGQKRIPKSAFIFILFIALLGFFRVTQNPRFKSYRTIDVIQLVVSGAGFGVALTGLIFALQRPRR